MKYSINDFELLKFFSYTSTIPSNKVIVKLDDFTNYVSTHLPNITTEFNVFYCELADKATEIVGNNHYSYFHDNKTVFKIRRKSDGKIFYIGRYDWRYAIGTAVYQYDGTQWDFIKNEQIGDYLGNYIQNYTESADE